MPRGIPKAKEKPVTKSIEDLKEVYAHWLQKHNDITAKRDMLNVELNTVQVNVNNLAAALSSLGSFARAVEGE